MKNLSLASLIVLQMTLDIPVLATQYDQEESVDKLLTHQEEIKVDFKEINKELAPEIIKKINLIKDGPLEAVYQLLTSLDIICTTYVWYLRLKEENFSVFKNFLFLENLYGELATQLREKKTSWFESLAEFHTKCIEQYQDFQHSHYDSEILPLLADLILIHKGYSASDSSETQLMGLKKDDKDSSQDSEDNLIIHVGEKKRQKVYEELLEQQIANNNLMNNILKLQKNRNQDNQEWTFQKINEKDEEIKIRW